MRRTAGRGASLLAFVELRALLVWRRLRSGRGTAEAAARAVAFLVAIPAGLVFAGLVGAGTFRAARASGGLAVDVPLAALFFGIWQTWTAVALTLNERDAVDLRRLLVYPVPAGRIYLLGLAGGIAGDPFSVFWLAILAGAFVGAALGRFGAWLVPLALALAAFALATATFVALVQELLARLSRSRWFREIAVASGVLGWLALSLALAEARRGPGSTGAVLAVLRKAQWLALPAALANGAARLLFGGDVSGALPYLLALVMAGIACGWIAFRIALRSALDGGEGGGSRPAARAAEERRLALYPERLGPVFEKELRYLLRHPIARVHVVVLPVLAAVVGAKLAPRLPPEAGEVIRALPLFAIAPYVHMATQVFWLNALGWERGGARLLFLAPIRAGRVILAKNGALLGCSTALFALCAGAFVATAGPPPAWALAGAVALFLGLAPVLFGLGNLVSVLNPRAAPFSAQRGGSVPALSGLAGMGILSAACSLFALPVLVALRLESPWLLPAAWTFLGGAGMAAYRAALPAVGRLLERRMEDVLGTVCGDEA